VRLTDSSEFQDATLLESLSNYIHYNTTMKSHQEIHGIMSISYHFHVSHYNFMPMSQPTNQFIIISGRTQYITVSFHDIKHTWYHILHFREQINQSWKQPSNLKPICCKSHLG